MLGPEGLSGIVKLRYYCMIRKKALEKFLVHGRDACCCRAVPGHARAVGVLGG